MDKSHRNRGKGTITTAEIARRCGVSRSTVSAVLNGKRNVRENTRKKVLECIRAENYDAGIIARTLVGELSRMIAVLAPNIGSPFHMMFFRGVNEVLGAEGYHVLFHSVRTETEEDPETLASLRAYRPAGYIMLKGSEGLHSEHAHRIVEEGVPLVSETRFVGLETHSVNFDNRGAMKLAADYLLSQGHVRLAHIAGPAFSFGARERKMGFVESLIQHDIPVSDAVIVDAGETAADGYPVALELLKNPASRPTALLCFNDMVAMGVYRAAHELGLDIPGELSVVGFDGIDFAELLGPPLTTVDIFPHELGKRAAALLLRVIRNETGRGIVSEWIEPALVERGSVRRLDGDGGTKYSAEVAPASNAAEDECVSA